SEPVWPFGGIVRDGTNFCHYGYVESLSCRDEIFASAANFIRNRLDEGVRLAGKRCRRGRASGSRSRCRFLRCRGLAPQGGAAGETDRAARCRRSVAVCRCSRRKRRSCKKRGAATQRSKDEAGFAGWAETCGEA